MNNIIYHCKSGVVAKMLVEMACKRGATRLLAENFNERFVYFFFATERFSSKTEKFLSTVIPHSFGFAAKTSNIEEGFTHVTLDEMVKALETPVVQPLTEEDIYPGAMFNDGKHNICLMKDVRGWRQGGFGGDKFDLFSEGSLETAALLKEMNSDKWQKLNKWPYA